MKTRTSNNDDAYLQHFRDNVFPKIKESAYFMTLLDGKVDAKLARGGEHVMKPRKPRSRVIDLRGLSLEERKLGAIVQLRMGQFYVAEIASGVAKLEPCRSDGKPPETSAS